MSFFCVSKCNKMVALLLALILVFSMGYYTPVSAASVKVSKVVVRNTLTDSTKTVAVAKGKTVKLKTVVTAVPNKASNKKVSYKSSNSKIATVSKSGVIKGIKPGKTKITVTSLKNPKKKATIKVTVYASAVTGLSIAKPESTTIKTGSSIVLSAIVSGKKTAYKAVRWTSSDKTIATVAKTGEVKALKPGTVKIIAKSLDGSNRKAVVVLTVKDNQTKKPDDKPTDKKDDESDKKKDDESKDSKVNLVSASVVDAKTISISLSESNDIKAKDISVFTKEFAAEKYENQLKVEKIVTKDKVSYSVFLSNDTSLYLRGYVQISVASLSGIKTVEAQYTEADVISNIPVSGSIELGKTVSGEVKNKPSYKIFSLKVEDSKDITFKDNYSSEGTDRIVAAVYNKTEKSYTNYSLISGDKVSLSKGNEYLVILSSRDHLDEYKYNIKFENSAFSGGISSAMENPDGCLTPQMYGAEGNGSNDDTEAFRKLFADAYEKAFTTSDGWKHCKAIYIPSGNYLINGTVIDEMLETQSGKKVRYAMFEVNGAGRETTNITFTGDILFDDQVHDESKDKMDEYSWKTPIFAFSTFRDIGFKGNQKNTLMTARDSRKYLKDENGNTILDDNGNPKNFGTSDGAQRLQFISCNFINWNKIIEIIHSTCQLSEVTFAYCKIADCGNSSNECCLFTMNCSQAVDWRFDYTDIESINGEIFHYIEGANVWINGGSIIMNRGTAFCFDFSTGSRRDWAGESNSPHLLCTGSFFEIRCDKTHGYDSGLLKTTSFYEGSPNVVFRSCKMGTGSNNSPHYLEIDGAAEILFDNCYDCSKIQVSRNVGNINRYINPRLRFINCSDVNVNTLATTSTANTNEKYKYINASDFGTNNVRVSVDNTYDFYIRNNKQDDPNDKRAPYWHSTVGLNLCRQPVKLLRANAEKDKDGNVLPKLFKTKPYGYVEKIEVTIPANNYAGTMTIYDSTTGKAIGESIQLKSSENKKYELNVGAYIEEFRIEFSETLPFQPNINMDIIKY